jgi:hypothetical protein
LGKTRLDLGAIEASLRAVQGDFAHINAVIDTPRDPLSDQVLTNLLAGYAYIDRLCVERIDPLVPGNSTHLLRLNNLVLWGPDAPRNGNGTDHFAETERRFYDDRSSGGVGALMEFLADRKDDSVWRRAAGAFIHVLSQPQLYLEGNHRTGSLIMSLMLMHEGKPPFVLTVDNAKAYFDPASLVKVCKKHSIGMLFKVPKLRKRLAALLKDTADPRYLKD